MKLDSSQIGSIIDDDLVPSVDTEALDVLLSNISNRLKGITGKSDWKTSPEISIDGIIAGLTDTDSIDFNYDATFKLITASVKDGWLSTNTIRNQNASAQTANFWISGSGKASSFTSTADSYFNSVRIGQGFTSGNNNVVLGYNVGTNITSSDVIAIGRGAMGNGVGGFSNIGIGLNALYSASGEYNIAIGGLAMQQTTTGTRNLAFGYQSLFNNTTGSSNIAIGYFSLNVNTTGGDNIAIGANNTLTANTIGSANIALGSAALASNISGSLNMALGTSALSGNTTGTGNVAIGPYALRLNTTGDSNVGIGQYAGWNNATGIRNVSIGEGAGYNNTGASTNYNTFIGYHSGYTNSGSGNVALGYNSGVQLSGSQNLYLGYYSGDTISSGNFNVVIGTYNLPSSSQSNSLAIADGYGNIKIYSPDTHNIILGGTTDNTLAKLQVYGALYINTIANATSDTDKFIVSDSGVLKYRTGAEVLSDIDGLSTSVAASTYVALGGSYANPAWITSLAWSKITGTPTTLTGYGITDATPSGRTVTMTGTANQILINASTSAQTFDLSANRTWTFTLPQNIATGSDVQFLRMGLGAASGRAVGPWNMQLTIESSNNVRGLGIVANSADVTGVPIYVVKSRGTTNGSVTALQAGDQILSLTAFGTDGTAISSNATASISYWVEGTVSTNIIPGYINFRTANSSGTLTEAFRINSSQQFLIGRTAVGTGEQFQVQGTSKFYSDVNLSSTVTIGGVSTINSTMNFGASGSIVMAGGTGTETGINLSNRNIVGVNRMEFFDSGPNEGLLWSGGNLWSIYDSPNDITTNTTGNIQFVQNGVRKATINTSGQLELPISTGTAPLVISSTTLVSNLNVDYLDGQHGSYYAPVSSLGNYLPLVGGTLTGALNGTSITTSLANTFNISSGPYNALFQNTSISTTDYNVIRIIAGFTSAVGYIGIGGAATSNTSFRDNFVIGTQTGHNLVFNTADSTKMVLFNSGRFAINSVVDDGINTLQVNGSSKLTGNVSVTGTYTQTNSSGGNTLIIQGAGLNSLLQKFSNTGGNAYIGLASSTGGGLLGSTTTAYAFGMLTEGTRPLILGTNNTARVSIDGTSGDVTFNTKAHATTGLGVGNSGGSTYGQLYSYNSTYSTTSNLLSLGTLDGTYNPRVIVSYTTATSNPALLKFDSTYSSGWGATNYSFATGIVMIGSATAVGSSVLQVTGASTFSSNLFIGGYLKQNTLNTDLRISANGTGFLSLNYDGGSSGVRISDGGGSNVIFSVTTTDGIFANPINTSSTAGTAFLVNASGYIKSRTASQVLSDIGAAAVSGGSGYIQNRTISGTSQTATFDIQGDSRIDGKVYIGANGAYFEQVLIGGNYRIQAVDSNGNKYVI